MPAFIHANGQRQPSSEEIRAPPEIYGKQLNFADVSARPQRALAVILLKTQGKRWANRFLPPPQISVNAAGWMISHRVGCRGGKEGFAARRRVPIYS